MNGVKFSIEALTDGKSKAQQVVLSSDDERGQQILFHFNRLFCMAIEHQDHKAIFRSLGMMSDEEINNLI